MHDGRGFLRELFPGRTAIETDLFVEIPVVALIVDERLGLGIVDLAVPAFDGIVDVDGQDFADEHIVRAEAMGGYDFTFDIDGAFFDQRSRYFRSGIGREAAELELVRVPAGPHAAEVCYGQHLPGRYVYDEFARL